jgi:adenylate cyclase
MRRYLDWIIPLLVLAGALALRIDDGPLVKELRNKVFDVYQRLEPRPYDARTPVRILAIDEDSLHRIGQWPWPRDILASIVDRLTTAGAAVALDVLLSEPDRMSPESLEKLWQDKVDGRELMTALAKLPHPDEALAKVLSGRPVVVAFALTNEVGGRPPLPKAGFVLAGDSPLPFLLGDRGATPSLIVFEKAAAGNGSVTIAPDTDGIVRRVPLMLYFQGNIEPSLSAEALRVAQGASTYVIKASNANQETRYGLSTGLNNIKIGQFIVPVDQNGSVILYDSGKQDDRFIPIWRILDPSFDVTQLSGRIVLIGGTAEGLRDFKPSPLDPVMAGVEVHAQILEQMINRQFLQRPDWASWLEYAGLVLLGLIMIVLTHRLGAMWTALVGALAVTVGIAGSWIAFSRYHMLFDPIYPSMTALAIYLSTSLLGYMRTEGERRWVRKAFGQYLAPAVVEELSRNPALLKLGGELRELTLMFSDIRDFTKIAEKLDPQALTHLINSILTPLTAAIHERKGTVDKYIGDCIMAFWNAPLTDPDHRRNALLAALGMREALAKANKRLAEEAVKAGRAFTPVSVGIGINSGPCSIGNMGSEQRMAYSALGDTVNLASRLESLTRAYGVEIIVGEDAAEGIADMALLEIDRVRVKGRSEPLTIYTLLGAKRDAAFDRLAEIQARFLAAYRRQDWASAKTELADCVLTAPSLAPLCALFAARVAHYETTPAAANWDGVYTAASKTG